MADQSANGEESEHCWLDFDRLRRQRRTTSASNNCSGANLALNSHTHQILPAIAQFCWPPTRQKTNQSDRMSRAVIHTLRRRPTLGCSHEETRAEQSRVDASRPLAGCSHSSIQPPVWFVNLEAGLEVALTILLHTTFQRSQRTQHHRLGLVAAAAATTWRSNSQRGVQ